MESAVTREVFIITPFVPLVSGTLPFPKLAMADDGALWRASTVREDDDDDDDDGILSFVLSVADTEDIERCCDCGCCSIHDGEDSKL